MRYSILLLALLLYNAGHDCLATHANSQESTIANATVATVATASTHSDKPPGIKAVKTNDDDGGGGGGSGSGSGIGSGSGGDNGSAGRSNINSRNDNNRAGVHVYQGKIGGQQTASPTATSTKHKQKHATQTTASRATYVTASTSATSKADAHRSKTTTASKATAATTTTTTAARRSESPFSTTTASLYNEPNTAVSEASMQPVFAYKAVLPKHQEKNVPHSTTASYNDNGNDSELDGASSKKIIGSSVVTSVSVILNGEEPEFTDATGVKVPKPQPSLQVASPIDLLNPDRYEFYTFDDNGELVKRLMTMQEIQSIVANGDGEGPTIIHKAPMDERDPEKNVQDIVNSVQTVLHTQVESNKNATTETLPVLDTPDVSSSWSMILPAIFGNTGGDIFPQQKPAQIIMIPETEIVETSTSIPATMYTTKRPKPSKRKPGQKRKTTTTTTTTEVIPQIVQEELGPHESVYTGMEQYQSIASNVQNFEGIPELNLKPLYQQMHNFNKKAETTTRRVFVNNQELVQTASTTTTTTEKPKLDDQLAKKPIGVSHKVPPHRYKIPNDGSAHSTKRPHVTHTKQKIKRKPSTTTSTTLTPETTATTSSTETPFPPQVTISPVPSISTTHKKKKKKPTRQPITHPIHSSVAHDEQSTHYTKPHPHGENTHYTKPHPHGESTHYTKPHPHGEKRKPSTQKPRPTHPAVHTNKHTPAYDQNVEGSIHHTTSNKINHHKRPRPHKTTTTTTTTTTTAEPPTSLTAPIISTPIGEGIIAEEYPLLQLETYVSPSLLNQLKYDATSSTTTKRPIAYPVPAYDVNKPILPIVDSMEETQLKKEQLPSLSIIQQQYQQDLVTEQPVTPMTSDDIHALMSFDQIMQSLQGDDIKETEKPDLEMQEIESVKKPMIPVKYDSAESEDQLKEMAHKKKKPVQNLKDETNHRDKKPSITKVPAEVTIATTVIPMTAHYGGSTLATMLAGEEDGYTGRPIISDISTESSSTEETTHLTHSDEDNAPVVLITQRPVFFATTRKPEDITTNYPLQTEETTDLPAYTQPLLITDQPNLPYSKPSTTVKPIADQAHVVKFEPLYAEDTEPIVTELTTTEIPTETTTNIYEQNEDTTLSAFSEQLYGNTDSQQSTESTESETVYTTQAFLRLPVSVPQKVDHLIAEDDGSTENPPGVADLKPHLNMEVLRPTDQILMGDFQTQAATVASTLVDGTNTIAAETFMSSNETKDELQFLMNDVIQQIANQDQYKLVPPEPSANRLTNFAQLNSSFLLKPTQTATPPQESSSSVSSYGQNVVTVAMDATTEPIYFKEPTPPTKYEVKPETISYETTTETPMIMETTTLIPSREELIKIEEEYLNSEKQNDYATTTEAPQQDDATTYRIPILSLSQIYAQQQQDELEPETQFQTEKEYATETVTPSIDRLNESAEYTTERVTVADMEYQTQMPAVSVESNETLHLENKYEQTLQQPSENFADTNKEEVPIRSVETTAASEEKLNSESSFVENTYVGMINTSQQQLEDKLSNNYGGSNLQTNSDAEHNTEIPTYVTMINSPIKKPMNSIEKQSIEQIYATMINAPNPPDESSSQPVDYQLHTDIKQSTEEQRPISSLDENTQQYLAGVNKESVENKPNLTVQQIGLATEEESTEPPVYEQTTPAYTMNTETSEEMLDELIATMYNQTGIEENPEDAYVKLGESTAKPLEQQKLDITGHETEKQSQEYTNKSNATATGSVLEYLTSVVPTRHESQETQLQQQVGNLNNPEIHMPEINYKPDSPEQPDAEDDQDQTGYQIPLFITSSTTSTTTTTPKPTISSTKRLNTMKPVSYYKQPSFGIYNQVEPPKVLTYAATQQRPMQRPAALSNLMASSTQATRPPVKLEPSPDYSKGLEASVANLDEDVLAFTKFCNELAFSYWKTITSEKISSARSLVLSPFALTSMLSMVFLGARGSTSGEMNEVLKLDDVVTFNPHLVFKNITESVERSTDSDIATAAFVREVFSDRNNGKILQFFKDKTQQFYAGHVEEVNFHVVNDIIRRRTNLLIKRHTMGKVLEYLRTNSVWVNGPLATISANLFQTDCSKASTHDRDGEMFFQVHPTVRQRRLVPIPAVLYKSGFTAGYEPKLDATVVAFGRIQDTVSTIYVMPGHQSSISPTDNLERLQQDLVELAFKENAWSDILTSLMDRPGMEVQLPRFSHRSFVNASLGLQKMGLKGLFKSDYANLRGLTGSSSRDIYLSDMIQINTFSTCGEERISDHHHVEMYPAPPLRKRNKDVDARQDDEYDSSEAIIDFGSLVQDPVLGRGFYDDLLDPKYLELPLPLRPRQARVPDAPRLRFDKPFLYFVRHNPTGMILFMGRFNPRLLP